MLQRKKSLPLVAMPPTGTTNQIQDKQCCLILERRHRILVTIKIDQKILRDFNELNSVLIDQQIQAPVVN
jgi:hypothetical protein